jgi:imidazolonepropionase-like amidohydrolase
LAKAGRAYEAGQQAVAHTRSHGVPVAAGSDAGGRGKPHGGLADELHELVKAGLSVAEAVAAATTIAARAARRTDLGSLAPGRRADMITVSSDPTADISALSDIGTVIAAGRVVKANGAPVCR